MVDILIIGGGAAGFFAGIHAAQTAPHAQVTILEAAKPLAKVRISGGGRCNVTTAVQQPRDLITHYPRGSRALRGPFQRFGPRETVAWFAQHKVPLKTEPDGRLFPTTDSSETVISCLRSLFFAAGGELRSGCAVKRIEADEHFTVHTSNESLPADRLLLSTGGSKAGHRLAAALGHTIIPTCPSIFTFGIRADWLTALSGLSCQHAQVTLRVTAHSDKKNDVFSHSGPVLITHWGLSGPAILRLSAFAARALAATQYNAKLEINWSAENEDVFRQKLNHQRTTQGKSLISNFRHDNIPARLLQALIVRAGIPATRKWAELSKTEIRSLVNQCTRCPLTMHSKGVFKEEFVTAGGVSCDEINWRTMASKIHSRLFFAGEIIDIDGVTGGFNFQAAWTTGYLAGNALAAS